MTASQLPLNWVQYRLNCAATWRAEQERLPYSSLYPARVTYDYSVLGVRLIERVIDDREDGAFH